ncbi:sigma-70 family RNA polymerase sigma factor [Streptomyces sp. NPDC050560]|uniref:sigma-70 family RNA polymerase sigma factor n=1 Tax=Streptomyces sp. NPDC050560 TaxID=3365630 RepID=UPI00379E0D76
MSRVDSTASDSPGGVTGRVASKEADQAPNTRAAPNGPPPPPGGLDGESAAWVRSLTSEGPGYEEACERLHALLLRVALGTARRRGPRYRITGPELDDLAHQAAADALMSVVRKVREFRGESRFTTWAYKFVIFELSGKLGRHFWRRGHVPLDGEDWDRLPGLLGDEPHETTAAGELAAGVRRAVETELTPHQRRIFAALVLDGVPLDALVARLGTNRNAVYKTMFDARRKLRARLVADGYLDPAPGRQP